MKRPLIVGNWKMHHGIDDSQRLAREILERVVGPGRADIVLAPAFTALHTVSQVLSGVPYLGLAAQDCHAEDRGAFTGEVSVEQLKDVGVRYVLVGHSERRHLFGESDDVVRAKVAAVAAKGLTAILCVGETQKQREEGNGDSVVTRQLSTGLSLLEGSALSSIAVAYEPVWAIGTGESASPDTAQRTQAAIRVRMKEMFGATAATRIRVLYGGSVKPTNARALLQQPDVDGLLVGGASLQADSFSRVINAAS